MRELDAWVTYLDVYGFSAMVASSERMQDVHDRLTTCHKQLSREATQWTCKPLVFAFSDSTLMLFETNEANPKQRVLAQCLEFASVTMGIFVQNSLPVRGGIAYGRVSISDRIAIGAPIVRAVAYEQSISEPLIILPAREVGKDRATLAECPSCSFEEIQIKGGGIMLGQLLTPSPLDEYRELVETNRSFYSLHGPPAVALAWSSLANLFQRNL